MKTDNCLSSGYDFFPARKKIVVDVFRANAKNPEKPLAAQTV
jgi:hypothetical protein